MQTTRFTRLSRLTLAVTLTLLVGQGLVFGDDDGDRTKPGKLEDTWNVTQGDRILIPCNDVDRPLERDLIIDSRVVDQCHTLLLLLEI